MEKEEKVVFLAVLQHKLNKQCLSKCTQMLIVIKFKTAESPTSDLNFINI